MKIEGQELLPITVAMVAEARRFLPPHLVGAAGGLQWIEVRDSEEPLYIVKTCWRATSPGREMHPEPWSGWVCLNPLREEHSL